ncbi:hypothetical protein Tel_03450 [Candidatus Tenderia electrophaga]|jgi:DNA-binding beta-propeller fold protein YncE|uniref:YNCE-like beta-propeller domain-containing protein n=1 Tax=Candidatus Tenderia electrophaga TaxID=1748243 RepID=A0A0S2TAU1_9GAMM|nr:hypothetical protein Tel_03450 [Candidatus Tenderia electrophaga]
MKILLTVVMTVWVSAAATATASPFMYVPTGDADDLVVIDLDEDKVVGRIGELENAHGLAASPNSEYLVAGSMQPVEGGAAEDMSKPASVSEDEHAAHHAGGDAAAMKSPAYLSIIEPRRGHVIRRVAVPALAHHTAISPDGKHAIAVHSGAGGISVVDLNTMEAVKTIQTGALPNYAVFSGDGRYLYVSNAGAGSVSEIDTHDWRIRRQLTAGNGPEHLVLSPDGARLFVADVDDGTVIGVNLKSGALTNRFDVGAEPHGIDISTDGRWLFVSSKSDQTLSRIDLTDNSVGKIDLQPAPYHVVYVAAVSKLYVSSREAAKIWVLDPAGMNVVAEIDIGRGVAHQMVIRPQ